MSKPHTCPRCNGVWYTAETMTDPVCFYCQDQGQPVPGVWYTQHAYQPSEEERGEVERVLIERLAGRIKVDPSRIQLTAKKLSTVLLNPGWFFVEVADVGLDGTGALQMEEVSYTRHVLRTALFPVIKEHVGGTRCTYMCTEPVRYALLPPVTP